MNVWQIEAIDYPVEYEQDLISRVQAGDSEASWPLIQKYAPHMVRIARRYLDRMDRDDLSGLAIEGLLTAVRAFRPDSDTRVLAAILGPYVENALARGIASAIPMVVPDRTYTRYAGIMRRAEGDVNVAVSLAPAHGMSVEVLLAIRRAMTSVDSLDEHIGEDDDGGNLHDVIPAALAEFDETVANDLLVSLAFGAVDELEKDITRLAYGFEPEQYGDPMPDAEIAHRVGMTRPTVQRRRVKALDKMRERLAVDET